MRLVRAAVSGFPVSHRCHRRHLSTTPRPPGQPRTGGCRGIGRASVLGERLGPQARIPSASTGEHADAPRAKGPPAGWKRSTLARADARQLSALAETQHSHHCQEHQPPPPSHECHYQRPRGLRRRVAGWYAVVRPRCVVRLLGLLSLGLPVDHCLYPQDTSDLPLTMRPHLTLGRADWQGLLTSR